MLTEELARPISKNAPNLISMDDLMQVLAETCLTIETTFMHYVTCINPLDVSQHKHGLLNILKVHSLFVSSKTSVYNVLSIFLFK